MSNPNLNELLELNEELFENAWFQKQVTDKYSVTIAIECYSKNLTMNETKKLVSLIRKHSQKIKKMFKVDCINLEDYIQHGRFNGCF